MKTTLPDAINTPEEARKFLTELHGNNESYHPEDDATECGFDFEDGTRLNKLMDDIYKLKGNEDCKSMILDPCEVLLLLDPDYIKMSEQDKADWTCPVCGSDEQTRPDIDFPETIKCCNKCGADFTNDGEIILDPRKIS